MVDDTRDLMSSSWPRACFPDGTMPGGHSDSLLLFFLFFSFFSLYVFTSKFMLFVEQEFWHHPVEIAHQLDTTRTFGFYFCLTYYLSHLTNMPSKLDAFVICLPFQSMIMAVLVLGFFFSSSSFYTTGLQSQESRIPEEQNGLIRTAENNYRGDFSHFSAFFVRREEKGKKKGSCQTQMVG